MLPPFCLVAGPLLARQHISHYRPEVGGVLLHHKMLWELLQKAIILSHSIEMLAEIDNQGGGGVFLFNSVTYQVRVLYKGFQWPGTLEQVHSQKPYISTIAWCVLIRTTVSSEQQLGWYLYEKHFIKANHFNSFLTNYSTSTYFLKHYFIILKQ